MKRGIRVQDVLLTLMFGALIALAHDSDERILLIGLAAVQLIQGHIAWLETLAGRISSTLLQIVLCFLLIGITRGVASPYYLVLLLPVVSAATALGVAGTIIGAAVAIGTYLSFLLFIDWRQWSLDPEARHTLTIQCLLPAIAAVLVNSLGRAMRTESELNKQAAEQLANANQQLLDAEAAVRRTERLAALGQLSAGLAHELRNPLGSIKGSADLLVRSAARENEVVRELAGIISDEVDRTNSLVTRFLDFARPLEPRREPTDLTRLIERAATHAGVSIIRNFSPDVPVLSIDPALMEQVLINLLSNAAQASANDAPITVVTRLCGDDVEIAVIDRGSGIPAEKIESIFNPFVTTKQTGVGLGLAIVAKIVDGHGGRMAVESEPGKGSAFRTYLPIHQ